MEFESPAPTIELTNKVEYKSMVAMDKKEVPLTLYGILAEKYNTHKDYVWQIVSGIRKPTRGKGAEILKDWQRIEENGYNWILDYKRDKSVVVQMEDIGVNLFIQKGVSSIYKDNEFVREQSLDLEATSCSDLMMYLSCVRSEFK